VEYSERCSALEFGHHEAVRGKLEEVEVVAVDFECAGSSLDVDVGQDLNDLPQDEQGAAILGLRFRENT